MTAPYYEMTISDLIRLSGHDSSNMQGEDFFMTHFSHVNNTGFLDHPCKVNTYMLFYCVKGELQIDINLSSYEIQSGTMFIYMPGNSIKVHRPDRAAEMESEYILMACSKEFVRGIDVRFEEMFNDAIFFVKNPCLKVKEDEYRILYDYYTLVREIYGLGNPETYGAIRSIGASMLKLFDCIWRDRLVSVEEDEYAQPKDKATLMYERFLSLLRENYCSHKDMQFYADRLYVTPKHMSKVIKQVSGKTVPQWIDSFVLLEGMNLLKYSDCSVKEIAFRLKFASVQSFHRFFKSQVGKTPMEYRVE